MLDETMMYSSAYFPSPAASLAEASRAKLELVCEKLSLSHRDHVLEIGTGWGGFAVHAAATRGCRVTTTTISAAQYEHARRHVAWAGLQDLVTVVRQDSALLEPDGAMMLQSIVIDDRAYEVEKASASFIRTHIFPGGSLPSVEVIVRCLARGTDLRLADLHELTPHYAETLRRWRANLERAADQLDRLGYDARFRRLWQLYLAYCEAGFEEGRIGVVQMLLGKPGWRPSIAAAPDRRLAQRTTDRSRDRPRQIQTKTQECR
jgi:cyclopropane-fatty-acyl-phospholipid synthase